MRSHMLQLPLSMHNACIAVGRQLIRLLCLHQGLEAQRTTRYSRSRCDTTKRSASVKLCPTRYVLEDRCFSRVCKAFSKSAFADSAADAWYDPCPNMGSIQFLVAVSRADAQSIQASIRAVAVSEGSAGKGYSER